MTDRSAEVIWGLTKRFNCNKTRWNGKDWTWSPFSTNGFHNASESANVVGVSVRKDKTSKNFRRTFTMTLKHKAKNGIAKRKTKSQANPAISALPTRATSKVAKSIQALNFIDAKQKNAVLRKLARAAGSTRSKVRDAAKAKK